MALQPDKESLGFLNDPSLQKILVSFSDKVFDAEIARTIDRLIGNSQLSDQPLTLVGKNLLHLTGINTEKLERYPELFSRFIEFTPEGTFATTVYVDADKRHPAGTVVWRHILPAEDDTDLSAAVRPIVQRAWNWRRTSYLSETVDREQVSGTAGIGGHFPVFDFSYDLSGNFASFATSPDNLEVTINDYKKAQGQGNIDLKFNEAVFIGLVQDATSFWVFPLSGSNKIDIAPTKLGYRIDTPSPRFAMYRTYEQPGVQAFYGNYWVKVLDHPKQIEIQVGKLSNYEDAILTAQLPRNIDTNFIRHQAARTTEKTWLQIPLALPISFSVPALGVAA